jgi:hypothetical protein
MKKNFLWSMLAVVLTTLFGFGVCSCGDDEPEPFMKIDKTSINFLQKGGDETVTITSNVKWTVSVDKDWITIDQTTGEKNGDFKVSVKEHDAYEAHEGKITIMAVGADLTPCFIKVTQNGKDKPTLTISGLDAPFDATIGSQSTAQELYIICNSAWKISGKPNWLDITPQSGTGNATVKVWPNSENTDSKQREATITISSGDVVETKVIVQRGSNVATCYATPSTIIRLTESIAWDYDFSNDLHHVYFTLMDELDANAMTDADVKKYVEEKADDDDMWMRRTPEQFITYGNAFSFYGLQPNTKHVILSVAYDKNNRLGKITRTPVSTKQDNVYQSPWTSNVSYGITVDDKTGRFLYNIAVQKDAEHGAYSDKFYSWAIVGTNYYMTLDATRAQLALYIYLELQKNPNPHDTFVNGADRSSVREHLEGPVAEASYMIPADISNDRYLQVVNWCLLSNGEFSGMIFNGFADLLDDGSSAKNRMRVNAITPNVKPQFSKYNFKELENNVKLIRLR